MLKLVFPLRRLPTLSREQFQKYWYETHGPLVRQHAQALRIRRYVQLHTLDDPINAALRESRGAQEPYDGVAELWWESRDDLEAALGTPEAQEAGPRAPRGRGALHRPRVLGALARDRAPDHRVLTRERRTGPGVVYLRAPRPAGRLLRCCRVPR